MGSRWRVWGLSLVLVLPGMCVGQAAKDGYAERLKAARAAYFRVVEGNDRAADAEAHRLLEAMEKAYPGDAVVKAYQGSLELLDVAHDWRIWNLKRQSDEGLALLDAAVAQAPDAPEARFLRAATSWHLPGFYHRRAQCEADFAVLAPRAERDAREGRLPPELAAAVENYWGQILADRKDWAGARAAFGAAVRIAAASPAGVEAAKRLREMK